MRMPGFRGTVGESLPSCEPVVANEVDDRVVERGTALEDLLSQRGGREEV